VANRPRASRKARALSDSDGMAASVKADPLRRPLLPGAALLSKQLQRQSDRQPSPPLRHDKITAP